MTTHETLILRLHDIGAIKFGQFTLKSGVHSPYYIDLRKIVSFPDLLNQVSECIYEKTRNLTFNVICGVPYTALPIATAISLAHNIPMVMRRKEVKTYGTKQQIEGVFTPNETCLVIEDVVTSGESVLETIAALSGVSLKVWDVVVLVNREQKGKEKLHSRGIRLHSVMTITDIFNVLKKYNLVADNVEKVTSLVDIQPKKFSYEQRAHASPKNSINFTLFSIMAKKRTNLCVAADLTTTEEVLKLADMVGPYICVLKTHVDIINDFNDEFIRKLQGLAKKHNFLLFEDRKYSDIGSTVRLQYTNGIYRISDWANFINIHVISGPGIIESLVRFSQPDISSIGLLLIAEMSSKNNLLTPEYTKKVVEWANHPLVSGFINMRRLSDDMTKIHMTPGVSFLETHPQEGVRFEEGNVSDQTYRTPKQVIFEQESDIIIVGRAIFTKPNIVEEAKKYQEAGWNAYLERLGK